MFLKNKLSYKNKNNKVLYFLLSYFKAYAPLFLLNRKSFLDKLTSDEVEIVNERVDYYNQLDNKKVVMLKGAINYQELNLFGKQRVYPLDLCYYTRHFSIDNKFIPLFGDVTHIPELPSITKSRPIHGDLSNSIIFKLDKVRHFLFIEDKKNFRNKKNMLVWRGALNAHLKNRYLFLEKYIDHASMDIGFNKSTMDKVEWKKGSLTINEQLNYKFIMSLEGNDVATNLKWIMSSNSLCFSPALKYETWFMEGKLIPNHHFVLVADDFSDVEEKMNYYLEHPDEAEKIIQNAHDYIDQFKNKKIEKAIKLKVLEKYFNCTESS